MKGAYYNENDPLAADWLEALIMMGEIAGGDVDRRSIEDVTADDLRGYAQHHFFAGIGVWSRALREAGWPDDEPVWTGSCPCQPFSAAGKGGGFADERHLWPAWFWLIEQHRPRVILGEQVAAKPGLAWFDLVSSDLEGADYACGSVDMCAAGVGAPHIRQRLWWLGVAHSGLGWRGSVKSREGAGEDTGGSKQFGRSGVLGAGRLGHASSSRGRRDTGAFSGAQGSRRAHGCEPDQSVASGAVVHATSEQARLPGCARLAGSPLAHHHHHQGLEVVGEQPARPEREAAERSCEVDKLADALGQRSESPAGYARWTAAHPWADPDWIACRDGKWRPVEPGTFPLAHGAPARVGRLRGYGNAIVLPLAKAFVEAVIPLVS